MTGNSISWWINFLLTVNADMEKESSQRFVNMWLKDELKIRGFGESDIHAEFKNRGWICEL